MSEKDLSHIFQNEPTNPVTVMYPDFLVAVPYKDPKTGKEKGNPRFGGLVLVDAEDIKPFKEAARAAAMKKHKTTKDVSWPFKDGDKMAEKRERKGKKGDIYKGKVVFSVKAYPPDEENASGFDPEENIFVVKKGQLLNAQPKDMYSGMKGCIIVAFAGNFRSVEEEDEDGDKQTVEKPNVSAYLRGFVKTEDGTRIGGGSSRQAFSGVVGHVTDENPEEGMSEDYDDSEDEMVS